MRIVFAGTPDVALPSLNALVESNHEVIAVVTRADAPQGRGRSLRPSPVAARAQELGLEVLKPSRPRDPDFVARLMELAPDCCPVVAYGALVPQQVIDIPAYGWVNLHFSLLPAWRGAAPVQHAVMAGDRVAGASTFSLVAALDAGPLYATQEEPIRPDDTSGDLLHRLSESGAGLLLDTLNGIENGTLSARPQPDEGVTLAPKITVDDARVDFTRPAVDLDRLIRGCTPVPGAWTLFRGERFKLGPATLADLPFDQPGHPPTSSGTALEPGRLVVTKSAVLAGTATTPLLLGQVQAQGKKPMAAADWARGVTFEPGERLGA